MPEQPLGIGIAGFWHVHADDYARQASEHPETRVAAVWDDDPDRARAAGERLGVPVAASLDELLSHPDVDAITVTCETSTHSAVIGTALAAGVPVFTEKMLAPTVAECEALARASREGGTALVVSLPRLAEPVVRTAGALVHEGALGELTYARVRMAHDGWLRGWLPERFADPRAAIGGAFADLGCHPAYLVLHFLGPRPREIAAVYGHVTGRPVEDNAVVTARYDDGAIGVAEASFVTTPGAFTLELRGTEATLLYGFGGDALLGKGGSLGEDWTAVPLVEPGIAPFDLWIDAILRGADTGPNLRAAIDLTAMIVAANTAAEAGRTITIPEEDHGGSV